MASRKSNGCIYGILILLGALFLLTIMTEGSDKVKNLVSGGEKMYTSTDLNVRSSPQVTNGNIIKVLSPNVELIMIDSVKEGFVYCFSKDGDSLGWVSMRYLSDNKSSPLQADKSKKTTQESHRVFDSSKETNDEVSIHSENSNLSYDEKQSIIRREYVQQLNKKMGGANQWKTLGPYNTLIQIDNNTVDAFFIAEFVLTAKEQDLASIFDDYGFIYFCFKGPSFDKCYLKSELLQVYN